MACRWRICKDIHYVLYPVSSIKEDHRPGARTPTIIHSRVRSLWPSASREQSPSINSPHILTVGTFVRASVSEDKQRISTVVVAPNAGLAPSEQSTNINSSHILTVGTFVRASASDDKQRTSTVVAAPSAGLAPSEQSRSINYSHILTVGTLVRASAQANNNQRKSASKARHPQKSYFCWYLLNNTIISKIILYESCSFSWRIRHTYQ